jgi:TonB-linked SusC/RagA family outer membrane protein
MRKFLLVCLTAVFALASSELWAQDRTVSGRITSAEDGSGLPGVNVVLKGSTTGTVTDATGNFSLSVPASGGTLVVTFIGLKTQEVEIGGRTVVDVAMEQDVTQLTEVVVSALGVEKSRDKLGTATSTIGGSAVTSSGETGVINSLSGKAAGLNITRNGGDPGAGSYIQLRGQNSIVGNLQPLIVIDGMPMFNSYQDNGNQTDGVQQQSRLNDLNPNDIASIEVLKSASASALWGSRAANGVIMITTKKGKNTSGKLNISYNGTYSIDDVNKVPDLQRTYGQGSGGKYVVNTPRSWGDKISTRTGADVTSGAAYVQFPDGTKRYSIVDKNSTQTYDHSKEVFQTGHYFENALNLSGGNERSNFMMSYSNLNQTGIIQMNSDYKRNTARVNASTMLTDKLHATVNVNYSNIRSNRIQQGSNLGGIFLGGLRTPADFDNSYYEGTYYNADGVATPNKQVTFRNSIGAGAPGFDNPFWTIRHNKSFSVVNRIIGNVELNYDLTDWLSLRGNAGVDNYTDRRTDFINAQSAILPGGSYEEQTISESQFNTNLFATAKKDFSDAFKGSVVLGWNYNNRQYNKVGAIARGFIIPDAPPSLANSDPANREPYNDATTVRTSAGFTEINAEIANQLFVTLTGRAESASTFGNQTKSVFFYPSASAAWQFTKMTGESGFLNFGKLRASFGVVGNEPGAYLNLTKYLPTQYIESWGGTLSGSNYGVGGYSRDTQAGNPLIKPERKKEVEGGFDLRFLNDRVNFSATAYYNRINDVILPVDIAASSGFSSINMNGATLENKGIELSLEPTWVKAKNGFTWSSNFIWFRNRNNVVSLSGAESIFLTGGGFSDGSSRAVQGHPVGVIWGTYYDKNASGGYVLDENGFPKLAPSEGVIGNPNPDFRASIGNTFSFKGFSLYALIDFQHGGQIWNGTRGALVNYGTFGSTGVETTLSAADAGQVKTFDGKTVATSSRNTVNADGSVTFRGTVGDYGGGKVALDESWYTNTGGGFSVNQPFVEDATWTRLREVTLTYTLNSQGFRSATKLSSVTFGVTGRNLALWTNYSGIDPETNLTGANNGRGIDYFQNPNTRSVLFKLTINY